MFLIFSFIYLLYPLFEEIVSNLSPALEVSVNVHKLWRKSFSSKDIHRRRVHYLRLSCLLALSSNSWWRQGTLRCDIQVQHLDLHTHLPADWELRALEELFEYGKINLLMTNCMISFCLHCTLTCTLFEMEGGTPFDATQRYAAIWRRLTFVIDNISPSTTFTAMCEEKNKNAYQGKRRKASYWQISLPFSPLIDISLPSSRRHITYGSGKPLALHVNVTFVPSLTTKSLLVIDSRMTGGTENVLRQLPLV